MDITPAVAPDRQVIEGYGPGGFRVSGVTHAGSVIVFPDATLAWPVATVSEISIESFAAVRERAGSDKAVEVLLLGCGKRMAQVPPSLRNALKQIGVVLDAMDTGAACRTYDVLLTEGRRIAAALLPSI